EQVVIIEDGRIGHVEDAQPGGVDEAGAVVVDGAAVEYLGRLDAADCDGAVGGDVDGAPVVGVGAAVNDAAGPVEVYDGEHAAAACEGEDAVGHDIEGVYEGRASEDGGAAARDGV